MPEDKPRYLMGVGSPEDIVRGVLHGVDMFDSTFPTRNARHNTLFTFDGKVRIKNAKYRRDMSPIEEGCDCMACRHHTKAFIRHSLLHKEPNGLRLATLHNLRFMSRLMEKIREQIEAGTYEIWAAEFLKRYQ
jgi:queuine tRNA-ribosyltransferase